MNRVILAIYDKFRQYPVAGIGLFVLLSLGLVWSVCTLTYKEDISDFLPLDEKNQTALSVYQDISGANKIYAIIATKDTSEVNPQELVDGVEALAGQIKNNDTLHYISDIKKSLDMDQIGELMGWVYANAPYFLTDKDYVRMDSFLSSEDYINICLEQNKQLLMFPSSQMLADYLRYDPLHLFSPMMERLKPAGMSIEYETYDGYFLSPDNKKAIVILESSFGAHESENNAALVNGLNEVVTQVEKENPNLDIHLIGGPVIAVSNANRIKKDSMIAGGIAGVLILALLIGVFRRFRNILLIVVSVGWGLLFAMGVLALYYDSISVIVIGIVSVILGIAVNYPLHLIDHLKDSLQPRSALKEIIAPLVVGNITTVGAFLCLVPLNATALHDLGLFSALLLVGTIVFVLLFLPHVVKTRASDATPQKEMKWLVRLANLSLEKNRGVMMGVMALTMLFGYFSLKTEFDSDMRHINYMTSEQKTDMAYFQRLLPSGGEMESLYVVSSGDTWHKALVQNEQINIGIEALIAQGKAKRQNEVAAFLISEDEQKQRLERWGAFVKKHEKQLTIDLPASARQQGFNPQAFAPFEAMLSQQYQVQNFDYFAPLMNSVFAGNVSENKADNRKSVVQVLSVHPNLMMEVKQKLSNEPNFDGLLFDVGSMNSSMADTLSDDFNYIGLACGFIVFMFLWISLGRVELAVLSFIPMMLSWIWILGIMAILGIKFNIVNVILATFIFGQGDDYTIFMTDGLSYEFAYRKKLLASYKNSIIVSALIMFIGIGALLFARHPALRSLGEVTVVGMLSVVLMAYLFPPFIFNWLTTKNAQRRYRVVTWKKIVGAGYRGVLFLGYILCLGLKGRKQKDSVVPAVLWLSEFPTIWDVLALNRKIPQVVILNNGHFRVGRITRTILSRQGMRIEKQEEDLLAQVNAYLEKGFSVLVLPEVKPEFLNQYIKPYSETFFDKVHTVQRDFVSVWFHPLHHRLIQESPFLNGGTSYMEIGSRISYEERQTWGNGSEQYRIWCERHNENLSKLYSQIKAEDLLPLVYERYLYKGREIENRARKALKNIRKNFAERWSVIQNTDPMSPLQVTDPDGQGEWALLLALMYPNREVCCYLEMPESADILQVCATDFVSNLRVVVL